MNKNNRKISQVFKSGISKAAMKFMRAIFYKLKNLENWQGYADGSVTLYKQEKEYVNAVFAMIAIIIDCINNKRDVDLDSFIAYVVLRVIRKACMWDLKPDVKKKLIAKWGNFENAVDHYVRELIEEEAGKEFSDALHFLADQLPEDQKAFYDAAKYCSNLIDYDTLCESFVINNKENIQDELKRDIAGCNVDREVISKLYGIVVQISNARNTLRWQGCGATTRCSISAHMLETAVFGWLMAIDRNHTGGFKPLVPQQVFAVGLLHDFPELWTNDIPSNCKRAIADELHNLREVSEELEREALEENFYSIFSEDVKVYFMTYIMLENIDDANLHTFIKSADYFAADCECYWMSVDGSRNSLFYNIMLNSWLEPEKRTPATYALLEEMITDLESKHFLDP